MKIPKEVKEGVKGSVGYNESENKDSFMVGTNVAFMRSEDYYEPIIKGMAERKE